MANEGRLTERQILRRLKNLAETNQDREFLPADSWGGLASEISWLPSLERGDPGRERVNALAVKVKRLADEFAHLEKRHKAANARCTMSLAAIAGLSDGIKPLLMKINTAMKIATIVTNDKSIRYHALGYIESYWLGAGLPVVNKEGSNFIMFVAAALGIPEATARSSWRAFVKKRGQKVAKIG